MLHMGSEAEEDVVLSSKRDTLGGNDVQFGKDMVRSFDTVVHSVDMPTIKYRVLPTIGQKQ